jgi:hypothetical protein
MTSDPKLDPALVWDEAGHLAELAVNALADGELAILPSAALTHAEHCASCAERVGAVALLALQVDETLAAAGLLTSVVQRVEAQAAREPAVVRRPLPVPALVFALLLALLGLLPGLGDLVSRLARLPSMLVRTLPILAQAAALVADAGANSRALVLVVFLSAGLLVLGGVMIARAAPRQMSWKGAM